MPSINHNYNRWGTGSRAGSATAEQLDVNTPCATVLIKAEVANAGNVYIGSSSSVTADPTADTVTCGYQLDAGQEVRLFIGNLNEVYYICDNAGDDFTFLWQG